MSVVFDKLGFMRHLESDGTFARPQAEKLSEAFHQAVQESVATKADTDRLEMRIDGLDAKFEARFGAMDAKLSAMEGKLDAKLDAMDAKMHASLAGMKVWMVGGLVALLSALTAIRFFGH